MEETMLPASPNWYLSSILACASDGTAAWGGRHFIVIVKKVQSSDQSEKLQYSIIEKAHHDRVTTIAFSPSKKDDNFCLVSGGDDNVVKIWNLKNLNMELHNAELANTQKVIGVDWSKLNPNLVCFVSYDGVLVAWDINFNSSKKTPLGKLTATCLACCPHDEKIVAVGSKVGLIYIVNVNKSEIMYKLRGHDQEIVSLSWCPVPFNVFQTKNSKDFLLASGAKDKLIFFWKAGSDGRYQIQLKIPNLPIKESLNNESNYHRSKIPNGYQTVVSWLLPTVLLSSSPWGELLMWHLDVNTNINSKPVLIHAKHIRGLFSIAGMSDTTEELVEEYSHENWRSKTNIKAIWTVAQDRQIICCNISNGNPSVDYIIPSQGGFIYCMSACPIDTSQIAFGVGDANIRIWNLLDANKSELKVLYDSIKGKVRALCWHPQKENLLAFATDEGRVGIIDTDKAQKAPVTCRPYFRDTVYSVEWGPDPNSKKEFALYACGDGELAYYPVQSFKENPCLVKNTKKFCTEFSWKPDDSLLAIGFKDGSIHFLNSDLTLFGHPVNVLNKAINCLVWHPDSTTSDLGISIMQNYLAVATNDTSITIFEISSPDFPIKKEEVDDNTPFYRIVATLNAHSEKVVCLAWSPHMSGYLVSGSCDKTVQVWKVDTQEVIASYLSHSGPVYCCMWSPCSQDLIITGSADFTLRIWSVSNQKIVIPSPSKSTSRGKKTKKKKIIEIDNTKQANDEPKIVENKQQVLELNLNTEEIESSSNSIDKLTKKRKPKKITHFPVYAEISNNNKLWCLLVENILNSLKNENQQDVFGAYDYKEIQDEKSESEKLNENIPFLMGTKKNLEDSLNFEKKKLSSNGHATVVTEIDFWTNNLKENLLEAEKNRCLNDFLVSLAPSISTEMWERLCESYAIQLMPEYPHKAVSYFLCVKKVDKAIDAFLTTKCFKEAYTLASNRLESTDPMITNVLKEWASNGEKVGNFKESAECYIKLGEYQKAAMILANRKDLYSLYLAMKLAVIVGDMNLYDTLAERALFIALLNSNINIARSITEKCPKLRCREPEVLIFSEINNALASLTDEKVLNWLKGSSDFSILKTYSHLNESYPEMYSLLLQKNELTLPGSEKPVQLSIAHELSLSLLSDKQQQKLEHIVKTCDIILQNEKNIGADTNNNSLLIKYLCILDNKSWEDSTSLFNIDENEISKSLSAFFCHSVIQWFLKNELTESDSIECENLLIAIFKDHLKNLLDKDAVTFWTTTNTINKLETQLALSIGKLEEDADVTQLLIEQIEEMKGNRLKFIETRVSSPNPLGSYGEVMKAVEKISNENSRQQISTLVTDVWNKAIL